MKKKLVISRLFKFKMDKRSKLPKFKTTTWLNFVTKNKYWIKFILKIQNIRILSLKLNGQFLKLVNKI